MTAALIKYDAARCALAEAHIAEIFVIRKALKAAAAAIGYEQPKIGSVLPSLGNVSRTERWRVYEMWSQRRQYIIERRAIPPPGWDDHLSVANYVEPPESEGMPPVDVIDTPQGFKVLSNLLPKPGDRRIVGNGSGSND
jgi:hypothetical protein